MWILFCLGTSATACPDAMITDQSPAADGAEKAAMIAQKNAKSWRLGEFVKTLTVCSVQVFGSASRWSSPNQEPKVKLEPNYMGPSYLWKPSQRQVHGPHPQGGASS